MEITLETVLKILRKYAVLIVVVALVFAVGAYAVSAYLMEPVYQAKALLTIVPFQVEEKEGTNNVSSDSTAWSLALRATETCTKILSTDDYSLAVKAALNLDYEPNITFSDDGGTTALINVTVYDKDPYNAFAIAQTAVNGAPEWIKAKTSSTITATVSNNPKQPKSPSSPNPLKNAVIAALFGAVAIYAIEFLREILGTKVKNETELSKRYGDIPVLAVVPDFDADIKRKGYGVKGGR